MSTEDDLENIRKLAMLYPDIYGPVLGIPGAEQAGA